MYRKLILIMVLGLIFTVTGCQAFNKNADSVFYGTAEMEQINISAEVAGNIKEIKVSEGETIKKSTVIAVINAQENTIRSEQAQLGIENASNELEKVNVGVRKEEIAAQKAFVRQLVAQSDASTGAVKQGQEAIKQGTALLKQAEISSSAAEETYTFKKKAYDDIFVLYQSGNSSKQELDTAEYNMNAAKKAYENSLTSIEGAKAQLSANQIQLEILQAQKVSYMQQLEAANQKLLILTNGAVKTSKTTAELGIKQAETNYELTRLGLEKTEIKSEIEGVINTINYSIGEYVLPGSVVATVSNTKNLWVKIYVPEKLLPQLKLNQVVSLSSDFIKGNIKGKIINISSEAEYTPMNIITKNDRERLVYAVKVQITDNMDNIKAGMLLDVQLK
jgi:HlyD family secretion protein